MGLQSGGNSVEVSLGPVDPTPGVEKFIFGLTVNRGGVTNLAPKMSRRTYSTVYAEVPIALSDHVPKEWKANNSVSLHLEFEMIAEAQNTIDAELRKLRKFMRKTRKTGEPPDLLYVIGPKQWTVRLDSMDVQPVLWDQSAAEQRVRVTMQMHTILPED